MSDQENIFGDADASFLEGSAPTDTEHAIPLTRTNFLPWHKPRKQWIRAKQWTPPILALANNLRLSDQHEPLRYLSLPGPDLLDIRSIQPECAENKIQLQFIGLNGGDDDSDQVLSRVLESQVRALPGIHPGSEVVMDRFEHLGETRSIAYARIISAQRSFDVVNIDLCGSFAESLPEASHANVPSALMSLVQHQAKHRSKDWLLFITTRSDAGPVNPKIMERFVSWLNEQIQIDNSILASLLERHLIEKSEIDGGKIAQARLSPRSHSNVFTVAFAHWILRALANETPAWRVDMLPHYEYHVSMGDPACDMISLGFWCHQLANPSPPDDFAIAKKTAQGASPIEEVIKNCSNKIRDRVAKREDVDTKLQKNIEEYEFALEASAKLLSGAMYDENAYRNWAEEQRVKMEQFLISSKLV